jgi:hypothetical protein
MIYFIRMHPNEMTEDDKLALIRFTKWDHIQRTAAELIDYVLKDVFQMWRVVGDPEKVSCLLLTRVIRTDRGGRTLYVEGFVGKGFSRYPKECCDAFLELAKSGNCRSVTGGVRRPGMIKMVQKGGLPIVAQIFVKETGLEGS